MGTAITNIEQLRTEIQRLRVKKAVQENELKQHFSGPKSIFNTLKSAFSRTRPAGDQSAGAQPDVIGWLSKLLLPLTVNKTLFGKSNFIVKSLAGLISKNVAGHINQSSVTGIWDKLKQLIPGNKPQTSIRKRKRDN